MDGYVDVKELSLKKDMWISNCHVWQPFQRSLEMDTWISCLKMDMWFSSRHPWLPFKESSLWVIPDMMEHFSRNQHWITIYLSPEITSWNKLHHHWDDSLRWGLEIHIFISRDHSLKLTYQSPERIPWIPCILEFHSSISGVVTIDDGLKSTYPSPEMVAWNPHIHL